MHYKTIQVHIKKSVCLIRLYRPHANNTINRTMVEECFHVLAGHDGHYNNQEGFHIVVLEGLPNVFCLGADLACFDDNVKINNLEQLEEIVKPKMLYDLWIQLVTGPYISIAHVRGKVNAGGIGFIAACDIVLASLNVEFSLSELLFDLFPACVLPFLIHRIGIKKANYMTLMTTSIQHAKACEWNLVDAAEDDSYALLNKYLLRLQRLSKSGITRYKEYMFKLDNLLLKSRELAIEANNVLFSNPVNLEKIVRYHKTGFFPWEKI